MARTQDDNALSANAAPAGQEPRYSGAAALLDALHSAGIEYIFANFGSDHSGILEAIEEARAHGRAVPKIVTCPNEMVAMSAAHGFAQTSGRAQAVFVHVECGTQALAGAIHNADKGRAPVFVFAGTSPFTQEGELKGSRNEFIQWIQDVHDQRGIVRGYMRYDNEIRTTANIPQLVYRALQFANSDPKGPVYLTGAREILEADAPKLTLDAVQWGPVAPRALPPAAAGEIAAALRDAKAPLAVTSFVGRNPAAVDELVRLCERLGIGVLESVPNYTNFPHDNGLYQGNQWNEPEQNAALAKADVVLVLDSDVPWIPSVSAPRDDARIFHIDVDPLKAQMPLWYIPAIRRFAADAETALTQINDWLDQNGAAGSAPAPGRALWTGMHDARRKLLDDRERRGAMLTPESLVAAVRERLDDNSLILSESVSNFPTVLNHLRPGKTGTVFASGGGSLGWNGGAAIGAKLAFPDRTVVAFTGDGSYMFTIPSTVHWIARRYATPFLTVIFNNGGWKSPKLSSLAVHPDGYVSRANTLDVSFEPDADYAGIAASAGGAFAATLERVEDLDSVLDRAFHAVRIEKRCAVINARLPRF